VGRTSTVAFERGATGMEGKAVELDDHAVVGPGEVHLDTLDAGVDRRAWQLLAATELDEAELELAANGRIGAAPAGERRTQRRHSGSPPRAFDQALQGPKVEAPGGDGADEALLEGRPPSIGATSRSVRSGEVSATPVWRSISSGASAHRWTRIPARRPRPPSPMTVTCTSVSRSGCRSHQPAAVA
jgi:hypothetical protein